MPRRSRLSPDRQQLAFVRRGQIWIGSVAAKTQRQLTNLPEGLSPAVPVFSKDGRWLAFTASRGGLEPEDLPWNGPMVRSMENVTRERRLGIVAAQGGDVAWIPTVGRGQRRAVRGRRRRRLPGAVARRQDPRDQDDARRPGRRACSGAIATTSGGRRPTATSSCSSRPTGSRIAFVSDRTGWIHLYVMPVDATSESQPRGL